MGVGDGRGRDPETTRGEVGDPGACRGGRRADNRTLPPVRDSSLEPLRSHRLRVSVGAVVPVCFPFPPPPSHPWSFGKAPPTVPSTQDRNKKDEEKTWGV